MGPNAVFSSILCLCLFLLATLASASQFLSDDIFKHEVSTVRARALLEDEPLKVCAVDFERQNYTTLTGPCRGPKYSAQVCCEAFKQFACPYTQWINDLSTDCAPAMFYYINLYGKYPVGLFADNCREGPEGLDCYTVKQPAKISRPLRGKAQRRKHKRHPQ